MKKLISLILLTTMFSCGVSSKIIDTSPPVTKTILLKSNKNTNFVKANEWMVKEFFSAESVIQYTDKEAGIIKGKYAMFGGSSPSKYSAGLPPYYAVITLRVKDYGSRIEIDPTSKFVVRKYLGTKFGFTPEHFNKLASELIIRFENHMKNKSENDNW